jgi:hypothetical protein
MLDRPEFIGIRDVGLKSVFLEFPGFSEAMVVESPQDHECPSSGKRDSMGLGDGCPHFSGGAVIENSITEPSWKVESAKGSADTAACAGRCRGAVSEIRWRACR